MMTSNNLKQLLFVTGNKNKLLEIQAILGNHFQVINEDVDLPEFQGDVDDVSIAKCREAATRFPSRAVIIEDTSLCFTAMGGLPGPYIKWFLSKLGPEGLFRMLSGWEDKSATAISTFAYYDGVGGGGGDIPIKLFQGKTEGEIVAPRGSLDFGWDPCFQPAGYTQTYGEMEKSLKNTISHRAKALENLKKYFLSNP